MAPWFTLGTGVAAVTDQGTGGQPPGTGSISVLWFPFLSPHAKAPGAVSLPKSDPPPTHHRFDSNASASSSSNEGDSDREEKKRKQLKRAKMTKDRKSRKKTVEVRTPLDWGVCVRACLCMHAHMGYLSS